MPRRAVGLPAEFLGFTPLGTRTGPTARWEGRRSRRPSPSRPRPRSRGGLVEVQRSSERRPYGWRDLLIDLHAPARVRVVSLLRMPSETTEARPEANLGMVALDHRLLAGGQGKDVKDGDDAKDGDSQQVVVGYRGESFSQPSSIDGWLHGPRKMVPSCPALGGRWVSPLTPRRSGRRVAPISKPTLPPAPSHAMVIRRPDASSTAST